MATPLPNFFRETVHRVFFFYLFSREKTQRLFLLRIPFLPSEEEIEDFLRDLLSDIR